MMNIDVLNQKRITAEKAKIFFQYFLMLFASFICGICFVNMTEGSLVAALKDQVLEHFWTPFRDCSSLSEAIIKYLKFSTFDLIIIAILFIFSFSVLNYIASDLSLVFCGFKLGFSLSLILSILKNTSISIIDTIAFVFFESAILIIMLFYSYKAAIYSFSLKITTSLGRPASDTKKLAGFLIFTLFISWIILLLNGFYCLIIYRF